MPGVGLLFSADLAEALLAPRRGPRVLDEENTAPLERPNRLSASSHAVEGSLRGCRRRCRTGDRSTRENLKAKNWVP